MACKEEKLASTREANSKGETPMPADQQKKLHEKLDKCKQDSQKVRASNCCSSNTTFTTIKPKANQLTGYFKM